MKKLLSLALCLVLIFSTLPVFAITANAADMTVDEIKNQITTIYQQCLNRRGDGFSGECGLYTAFQLYYLGINASPDESFDGKYTFEYYNNKTHSSGGYAITSYPASRYTLKSALNELSAYGTRNVYNLVVGLEKGNTGGSSTAGHAMVIHAIIDGIVYFSESGGLGVGSIAYYPEGSVIAYDINFFCDKILMYTIGEYTPVFDGVIHFTKNPVTQLTATGVNYPISKQTGQTFQIFGNIASPNYLDWVQCYVLDSTQNGVLWAGYGFTDAEKAQKVKTYNVNWLDARMAFASLPAGTYTYCVEALDDKGYFVRVANNFTVSSSGTTSGTETKVGTHDHTRNSNYTWGSWSTIKSATCTTEGKQTRTCYCGEVETKTISAKGHTYDDDQDPDCNTCGYLRNPSAVQLLSYTISNDEATITDCHSGISGDFTIPSTLGGYPVTTIGSSAFSFCDYLTSITIPNSVTSIGNFAFNFSESLTNITIPNSVTSIGNFAFKGCTSLNNVYYRGTEEDKNKITIGSYNTELTNATWYYNSCIGKANHTLVTMSAVSPGCETEGRTEITACVFCDYQVGGEIIPPTGHTFDRKFVSSAYKATDGDCTHRATYYYSCNCGKAGTRTFTDLLSFIPGHTYDNDCDTNCNVCGDIRQVAGHTYTNEMDLDCNKCGAVRDVSMIVRGTCGDNVTWYLNTDTKVLTLTGTGATYNYVNVGNVNPFVEHRANIKSIVIGDGITHLGNRLFRGLNHTTSVTFGKDVVTMGYEVFYANSKLANVTLNEGLTMLGALTFYNCTALKQINIPSTVTNLQNRAFKGSGLTSVVVPDTVKTLGYEVFMNCANLETVDFTEGCSMLNPRMFENCTSLKEFNFTRNMCRIRSRAFYGCTALQSITFEDADNMWGSSNGQEAKIASNAFEGCNSTLQMTAKKGSHVESYT